MTMSATHSTPDAQIKELELALLDPQTRASRQMLDSLLCDEFTEFGAAGVPAGKREIIAGLLAQSNQTKIEREAADMQVSLLSNTVALVTYTLDKRVDGAPPQQSLRSSVWLLRDGRWQMRFHQGTRAA